MLCLGGLGCWKGRILHNIEANKTVVLALSNSIMEAEFFH